MNRRAFWQYKLAAFFHDPPGKPFAMMPKAGGHVKLAKDLARCAGAPEPEKQLYYVKQADFMASGADRPVMCRPGQSRSLNYYSEGRHLIVHPLAPASWLLAAQADGTTPRSLKDVNAAQDDQREITEELVSRLTGDWQNESFLEELFYTLWRGWREGIQRRRSKERAALDVLWHHMPAETRCPDHSIWDHLRITSALAFRGLRDEERHAWLFTFSLTPVQEFLREARTSRDLWLGSFLLADLIWHAMSPVVDRYGADAVVYPDLRGNPRADHWLKGSRFRNALPEEIQDPASYAAVLPATFTAIVPKGGRGEEYLVPIEELGAACQRALQERWADLAARVETWLGSQLKPGWKDTWKRQHQRAPISGVWSAVAWQKPMPFTQVRRGGALPFQKTIESLDEKSLASAEDREARLEPWVPKEVWTHYELAREVFAHTNVGYLREGGFEYALLHHQLRTRHTLRKATPTYPPIEGEQGEKCTVCRQRAALFGPYDRPSSVKDEDLYEIDHRRSKTREFWSGLDEEGEGRDRLCGVCALKRFLVDAYRWDSDGFNTLWAGRDELARLEQRGIEPRVPFPATAAVAAQKFLAEVAQLPDLADARRAVVDRHDDALRASGASKFRTAFARALPRLAAVETGDGFLQLDTQTSIFPAALRGHVDRLAEKKDLAAQEKWQKLFQAVKGLRDRARALNIEPPRTNFAVVRLDGDRLGALLLGDPERIATTWRDVLHPEQVKAMEADPELRKTGWPQLFDCRRLMGPSLHAFISRVLAEFSHRVVPWVVEREFGGRLIYAGGDDVLALAPAEDALPMAARLHQLFRASWVVDTAEEVHPDPWAWRRHDHAFTFDPEAARLRFAILATRCASPATLPFEPGDLEIPVGNDKLPDRSAAGVLLPMLGPGASLSAGIAYAHYKTPLGLLLKESSQLLHQAKKEGDRAAVGLSYSSRGGEKARVVLKWEHTEQDKEIEAYRLVGSLVRAFRDGRLPGRLPYKLRQMGEHVPADLSADQCRLLLEGLVLQAFDGEEPGPALKDSVSAMWRRGFELYGHRPERSADGLLLCRALAGDDVEEDLG